MNVGNEETRSIWMDAEVAAAPSLDRNEVVDVAVVGAGIAGLSVAYELASRGRSVAVVDRGRIGFGMTIRTTAHLVSALDDTYASLTKVRNKEIAGLLYASLAASIDRAEDIQGQEEIDCDFKRVDGYLFLAPQTPEKELDDELECCKELGIAVEDCRERLPLHSGDAVRSVRFLHQGRFHPAKYMAGLARAIKRKGGRLYANTAVIEMEEQSHEVLVKTESRFTIHAKDVVVATNSPINDRVAIHSKQAPYRTYVIAAPLPEGELEDALYWDTLDPYHYVRLVRSGNDVIALIGGEDHKSGEMDDGGRRFDVLEQWARGRLPKLGGITHRWSGQVLEPLDYVGFVGRNPGDEHTYVVTGDSGQGLTNGLVGGLLIADVITTGSSPWQEVYDPSRKITKNIGEYIEENVTPLKNFAEYVTAGDFESVQGLNPGEGGLYRHGLKKIAACRDRGGELHLLSASCTHLGCVVHWNSTEQCWDCPCHGSQFAASGAVLNGPAVSPLAKAEENASEAAE